MSANQSHRANVEKDILNSYQFKSPSDIQIDTCDETLRRHINRFTEIFFHQLKLAPSMFAGKRSLEFGCGAGTLGVVLNSWGCSGVGVDFNPIDIERAKQTSVNLGFDKSFEYVCENILEYHSDELFDFVICDGVMPHVGDVPKLINNLKTHVKKGGFVVIGTLELLGNIQRLLHSRIVKLVSNSNSFEETKKIALRLFDEHLQECMKWGFRDIDNIIVDYIENQHSYGIDSLTLLESFLSDSFRLHTSYPYQPRFVNINPINRNSRQCIDAEYLLFQQLSWMSACKDGDWDPEVSEAKHLGNSTKELQENISELKFDSALANINQLAVESDAMISNFQNLFEKNLDVSLSELRSLIETCSEESCSLDQLEKACQGFKRIFSGYNGFGTAYFCFHKA